MQLSQEYKVFIPCIENVVTLSQFCVLHIQNFKICKYVSDILKLPLSVSIDNVTFVFTHLFFFFQADHTYLHKQDFMQCSLIWSYLRELHIQGNACWILQSLDSIRNAFKTTILSKHCHLELFLNTFPQCPVPGLILHVFKYLWNY